MSDKAENFSPRTKHSSLLFRANKNRIIPLTLDQDQGNNVTKNFCCNKGTVVVKNLLALSRCFVSSPHDKIDPK